MFLALQFKNDGAVNENISKWLKENDFVEISDLD